MGLKLSLFKPNKSMGLLIGARGSIVLLTLIGLLPLPGFSAISLPSIEEKSMLANGVDLDFARTGIKDNMDDLTEEQELSEVVLTKEDQHEAKVWQLSIEEEKRYKLLMQNKSKVYYKGLRLTPLDILGINARTGEERAHFAELSATFEAQRVAKNLAWNSAHFKAYQKVVAGLPVVQNFDASKYSPHAYRPIKLKAGQQLHFYVKKDDPISTLIAPLVTAVAESQQSLLVINCLNCDQEELQLLANKHSLPKKLVDKELIRLELGDLAFEALNLPAKEKNTPLLISVLNSKANLVDLGSI